MRIGFIGIGNMGRPMASRLVAAGYALTVHDVSRDAPQTLIEQGAAWADSPAEVAAASEIICLSLPGPVEAEAVVLGERGVLTGAHPDSVVIDFTTNSPLLVKKLHDRLRERQVHMLDAPVGGGVEGAKNGTLTILVGGKSEVLERCRGVFKSLAQSVIHVGETGQASICKVLHNCAVFGANLATVECLTAGVKAGVDAATLIDVFQKSGLGRNLDLQVAMPATLFRGNFEPRFLMKTARKDMALATELARAIGVPMNVAELCERDMIEAMNRGWGERDNTIFLTLQEKRAGADVRVDVSEAGR
jgi:3-hydroxyisobutyrate dehydrogenase